MIVVTEDASVTRRCAPKTKMLNEAVRQRSDRNAENVTTGVPDRPASAAQVFW